jgi:DNA-directed RNA polymerase subunit RPC12/RpoP
VQQAEPTITCEKCGGKLEVVRRCRQVRLKCSGCRREFEIHEVASRLDSATEAILGQYPTIIYD